MVYHRYMSKGHALNKIKTSKDFARSLVVLSSVSVIPIATSSAANAATANVTVPVNVSVASSISISGSPSINVTNMVPGLFYHAGTSLYVTTNNINGYTLSMSMVSGATNNSLNLNGSASSATIPTISGVKTESGFGSLSSGWGYSIDGSTSCNNHLCYYRQLPNISDSVNIKSKGTPAERDETQFEVGIKPSENANVGTYTNTVTFSAVTNNPAPAKTLSRIEVTTQPSTKTYTTGANFDPTGMVVTAYYSDNSSKVITSYTIRNGSNLQAGTQTITIAYSENGVEKTATLTVTVSSAKSSVSAPSPSRTNQPVSGGSTSSESNEPDDTTNTDSNSGNVEVQGVTESYSGKKSLENQALSITLGASSVAATAAILFLLARRKDDDDDEEDKQIVA